MDGWWTLPSGTSSWRHRRSQREADSGYQSIAPGAIVALGAILRSFSNRLDSEKEIDGRNTRLTQRPFSWMIDHLIRLQQEGLRDRQAERLGRPQ